MSTYGYLLPTRGAVLESGGPADLAERLRTDVVELAREAEANGFDSVWVGDSVLAKPRPEPMTTLAAVGAVTDDLTLGTAVYLPTLRHPVHVAHQAATLSLLTGGRVALGMGVGRGPAVEREYANLGKPFDARGRLLDEALEVVSGLLDGGTLTYEGEFFDLRDASIGFSPAKAPGLYVPYRTLGEGEPFPPHVRDRIVAHGDGWLPIAITPETYRRGLDA
ncbi:MAG: LLM class flavin-dependent oxidoreductase, partial [Salinigranum sp.]